MSQRTSRVSPSNASATVTASEEPIAPTSKRTFLYLLFECRRPLAGGMRWSLDQLDQVHIGRGSERKSQRAEELTIEVPDPRMSTRHARLTRLARGWAFEDLDSKNGSRVQGVATKRAILQHGDIIEIGETFLLLSEELAGAAGDIAVAATLAGLRTLSPQIAADYEQLAAMASTMVSVLVHGETGTGKELVARAVHDLSRRDGRFVAVNCGALTATLLEAELFGHRQGAFSGSVDSRPGLVRSANRGTLFLDEIGDLPLASQAALLRVLQEKEVLPVGETTPVRVDVRVVAATHRDLRDLVDRGSFRADLLARLEGYVVWLAPLRERRCDIGLLTGTLIERLAAKRAPGLSLQPAAARRLVAHDWPFNIRELEQALAAAIALADDGVIKVTHLPKAMGEPRSASPAPSAPEALSPEDTALRERLISLLEEQRGSINGVARSMGKDRTQIRRWLTRLGIDAERWRG